VKRTVFRKFLYVLLGLSALFAIAPFLLPYDWKPDPGARFKIAATQVKRDRSSYWINVHLKKSGEEGHDLMKPVRLITSDGNVHEPADTSFAGGPGAGTTEIWFKFWLDERDLKGPLKLQLNDGILNVKSIGGLPRIADATMKTFTNSRW
jgi:hypothetical protein